MVETGNRLEVEWVVDGAWCKSSCETVMEVPEDETDKHCSVIRQDKRSCRSKEYSQNKLSIDRVLTREDSF